MADHEAVSSRNSTTTAASGDHDSEKVLTESDMAAAHQLMQLSDEDNNNNNNNNNNNDDINAKMDTNDEEVDQSPQLSTLRSVISWAKINMEEIFGKDEEEEDHYYRPKKRRYRSLANIYLATKPILNVHATLSYSYGKKVKT